MDKVCLRNLSFEACHGLFTREHTEPQGFNVDVELSVAKVASSDDIADVVDFGWVYREISTVIQGPHCNLIETLANRIADRLLAAKLVEQVLVRVTKADAPLNPNPREPREYITTQVEVIRP